MYKKEVRTTSVTKSTTQGVLIVDSYLGRSWWVVTPQAYNFFSKRLKPALFTVLVHLGYHTFETPEVILFSRPLTGITTLQGAHSLVKHPVPRFLQPSPNLPYVPSLTPKV